MNEVGQLVTEPRTQAQLAPDRIQDIMATAMSSRRQVRKFHAFARDITAFYGTDATRWLGVRKKSHGVVESAYRRLCNPATCFFYNVGHVA